jgi:RHS repeat-associated protein
LIYGDPCTLLRSNVRSNEMSGSLNGQHSLKRFRRARSQRAFKRPRTRTKYAYDANGNVNSRNGSAISWTSYNYPSGVGTSTESATFDYGPDRQRWRMVYTGSAGIDTTYYATPLLEVVHTSSGTDCRNYLYAGGRPVMQLSRTSAYGATQHSLLVDQQNSISTIVADSTGTSLVNESFTAFGNRREASTWTGTPTSTELANMASITREGYTFQTVLGSMGLNHMNGRVEDSVTGRFLSPDPTIPDQLNTQSFNRFSYVNNNPLTYIDPTGFTEDPPPVVPPCLPIDKCSAGGNVVSSCGSGCTMTCDADGRNCSMVQNSTGDHKPDPLNAGGLIGLSWVPWNSSGGGGGGSSQSPAAEPITEITVTAQKPCANYSGHGVLIQVGFTDAHSGGKTIPGANHTFVIAVDPTTGQAYASRGGPGSGNGGAPGVGAATLAAHSGSYGTGFPDYGSVSGVQTVGYVDAPYGQVTSYMDDFATAVNASGTPYLGASQNSNSYTGFLIAGLGFDTLPMLAMSAPGFGMDYKPIPNFTCTKP